MINPQEAKSVYPGLGWSGSIVNAVSRMLVFSWKGSYELNIHREVARTRWLHEVSGRRQTTIYCFFPCFQLPWLDCCLSSSSYLAASSTSHLAPPLQLSRLSANDVISVRLKSFGLQVRRTSSFPTRTDSWLWRVWHVIEHKLYFYEISPCHTWRGLSKPKTPVWVSHSEHLGRLH